MTRQQSRRTSSRPFLVGELWLLDGATGSGKSTALEYLRSHPSNQFAAIRKLTTRSKRLSDNDWEFDFVSDISEFGGRLVWESVGARYAVDLNQLGNNAHKTKVMVCTELSVQMRLVEDYGARVLYFYRPMSDEQFEALLSDRGSSSVVRDERREERASIGNDYPARLSWNTTTILNLADLSLLEVQLERLVNLPS